MGTDPWLWRTEHERPHRTSFSLLHILILVIYYFYIAQISNVHVVFCRTGAYSFFFFFNTCLFLYVLCLHWPGAIISYHNFLISIFCIFYQPLKGWFHCQVIFFRRAHLPLVLSSCFYLWEFCLLHFYLNILTGYNNYVMLFFSSELAKHCFIDL